MGSMVTLRRVCAPARRLAQPLSGLRLRALLAPLVALGLSGCATLDPYGQTPGVGPALPPEAPRTTGVETPDSAQHKRLVEMFGGEYRSYGTERHLNAILTKLAAASDKPGEPYRVTILNSQVVNAFALPGGNVYVTRGMLALANDSSELAAVMAHEIGHITAGHAGQRAEAEKDQQLIRKVTEVLQKDKGEQVQARGAASLASFSRQQEFDADQIGVTTIAKAGYDPFGAARFLTSLSRSAALRASLFNQRAGGPQISSSHPSTPERIARATAAARAISAPGQADARRSEYLAAIDGIDFGDNPAEGLVRGRRFTHPRLGFTFLAPEGFVLENTPQAVLGLAAGGAEALRLDSVSVAAETSLEDYLAMDWIQGLQPSSVKSFSLNGLPAATGTAKSGEWRFRVGVIRMGGDIYRMIFATTTLSDRTDQKFRESLDSFRQISRDEAGKLQPLHVRMVAAGAGDTAEAMAGRMALADRPLEWFLLLNGLDRPGALKAGESFKVIVD
jgi:predicted Zn-dependent protease